MCCVNVVWVGPDAVVVADGELALELEELKISLIGGKLILLTNGGNSGLCSNSRCCCSCNCSCCICWVGGVDIAMFVFANVFVLVVENGVRGDW